MSEKTINIKDSHLIILGTLLLSVLFYLLPFKPQKFGDFEYHNGAKIIANYIVGNGTLENLELPKGLLTNFFYVIPYTFALPFDSDEAFYIAGIIWNSIFLSISTWLIFITIKFSTSRNIAWISLWLLTIFPIHIYYGMGIIAETPAFFITSVLLYYWHKRSIKGTTSNENPIIIGALIALLISVRLNAAPILLFLMFLALLSTIKSLNNKYPNYKRYARFFFMTTVVSLFLSSIIFVFTHKLDHNKSTQKSELFYHSILQGRYEFREDNLNWLHWTTKDDSIDKINSLKKRVELDSQCSNSDTNCKLIFLKWVIKDISENKLMTIKQYFIKFFHSQTFVITPLFLKEKPSTYVWLIHIFINLINCLLVFSSLTYLIVFRKNWIEDWPLWAFWLSFFAYVCLLHSEPRYMYPLRPFLLYMTANIVYHYERFKKIEKLHP